MVINRRRTLPLVVVAAVALVLGTAPRECRADEIPFSIAKISHAIPAGPTVSAAVGPRNSLVISWTHVTSPPPGFPNKPINIAGYQVIVGSFQVTVPATTASVTVPPEFGASLASGVQPYEVLAIEASANQTLTEATFVKP